MTASSFRVTIGVDPGLRGGMARLEEGGPHIMIEVAPIPIIPAAVRNGKKLGRDQYDLAAIRDQLRSWLYVETSEDTHAESIPPSPLEVKITTSRRDVFVFVEQSIPLPPKLKAGSLAQFQRGVCRGWSWMLTALEIPHELVHPRTWQSSMLRDTPGKDTKARSLLVAQRLFPTVELRRTARSRKADDGLSDALLIAEYGRRRLAGLDPRVPRKTATDVFFGRFRNVGIL